MGWRELVERFAQKGYEKGSKKTLRLLLRGLESNGEIRQDGNTGQMIFNVAELVAWASTLVTLEPGDIIATGTLSGVGAATGNFLNAGDNVEGEIEGIGVLKNPVTNA